MRDLLLRGGSRWISDEPADVLVREGAIAQGAPADLVVVAARTAAEAVVRHPVRELVLKAGRVVARDGRLV